MTAPELKPCPFCGGEAEIWRAHEGRTAWIACMGKCVVLISKEYLSDDEAIAAWNRRADLAAVQHAQVMIDDQERNYLHLHTAAFDVWRWFETTRPDLIGTLAEKLRDAVMGPRPFGCVEPQPDPRTADYEQAYQYALTLADALMAKHYPDNKDWRPLGDLTGLLTQIDNMVAGKKPDPRELTVWYGKMPESNGRENWTAILRPKAGDNLNGILDGFCFAWSEYPDRVRYEADRMRWIIGELTEKPDILAYDADLHSGYVERPDPRDEVIKGLVEALGECRQAITDYMNQYPHMAKGYLVDAEQHARAALAAAKAVQHG